ncbi:MAG: quinolinate synthase NadA [Elusimicrobiota bacterium]
MNKEIEKEILRLKEKGLTRICVESEITKIAELTFEINKLKKEKKAVIAAHVYQRPEVIIGVSDFHGDSFKLAKDCVNVDAEIIIFCGVSFMAQTAKILNPKKRVFIPDTGAGCSLSESITVDDVKRLKKEYPEVPVVTYINTNADVKAESDVVVTSSNAKKILEKLYEKHQRIIFIPDKFMGANLAKELGKEAGRDLILWNGSCIVHEKFNPDIIKEYRKKYPNMMVMAHSECPSDIIKHVDFMGSTSQMIEQLRLTDAQAYMLITECGLGELATTMFPEKKFIAMCRLCPYMKMITLENILFTLKNLPKDREIFVDEKIAEKAKASLYKMFEFS